MDLHEIRKRWVGAKIGAPGEVRVLGCDDPRAEVLALIEALEAHGALRGTRMERGIVTDGPSEGVFVVHGAPKRKAEEPEVTTPRRRSRKKRGETDERSE